MLSQTTHVSLLQRLGTSPPGSAESPGSDPQGRAAAWAEFCDRYGDLIRTFARRKGLQEPDCDDVLQDVLAALTQSMPGFQYDPQKGKFRSYLKTVTLHVIFAKLRQKRGEVPLEQVEAEAQQAARDLAIDALWDEQWRQYHLALAMRTIQIEFNRADRDAFQMYALEANTAEQTAQALGMSTDQVYKAKSRIVRRLSELITQQVREEG